jgi:hypothetical protein
MREVAVSVIAQKQQFLQNASLPAATICLGAHHGRYPPALSPSGVRAAYIFSKH